MGGSIRDAVKTLSSRNKLPHYYSGIVPGLASGQGAVTIYETYLADTWCWYSHYIWIYNYFILEWLGPLLPLAIPVRLILYSRFNILSERDLSEPNIMTATSLSLTGIHSKLYVALGHQLTSIHPQSVYINLNVRVYLSVVNRAFLITLDYTHILSHLPAIPL